MEYIREHWYLPDISKPTFFILLNDILDTLDQFLMNCSRKKSVTSQTNPVVKVKY